MRSSVGQLNWLAGITRPDLSFDVCQFCSKVTTAVVEDLIQLNKVIHRARRQKVSIVFPKINFQKVRLTTYADASFNNLPNGGSQEGHIIFINDDKNNYAPLSWVSNRIKRVVRSTLAAKAIALNNACEDAIYLGKMISMLSMDNPTIPIVAFTDNKSTLDTINSSTSVSDKKLRLEIALLRETQERKEVEIMKVPGKDNISDVLTKRGASSKSLLLAITRGNLGT